MIADATTMSMFEAYLALNYESATKPTTATIKVAASMKTTTRLTKVGRSFELRHIGGVKVTLICGLRSRKVGLSNNNRKRFGQSSFFWICPVLLHVAEAWIQLQC